ncbi:uncharacterized protein L969DRAFT_56775 [Mixia osmundae IAM 14324]|uniref:Pentacotripeptide-repeat region of PRORP domain-containing protein n=1 Tax=Mixia osmundae (strain CBS 9802 / IAM 14324 / JCM 22182 / KY 12970) TaxID=764103 RepID=G7EAG5_MIXOS|nr:uncharacterized protein L969DRAFT_56775 [Mixia osmundae IAM 14324]KEI42315.1 hypothetical protein L969DRAFT_56775 [Mixia osmundae IAM 14324]GAA99825.1 hypothetical protein E5Q_06528 [Mixia osmundae IAM 14324]
MLVGCCECAAVWRQPNLSWQAAAVMRRCYAGPSTSTIDAALSLPFARRARVRSHDAPERWIVPTPSHESIASSPGTARPRPGRRRPQPSSPFIIETPDEPSPPAWTERSGHLARLVSAGRVQEAFEHYERELDPTLKREHPELLDEAVAQLAKLKDWPNVLRFVQLAKSQSGKFTTELLGWRLRADFARQDVDGLKRILSDYAEDGLAPSLDECRRLARHLLRAKQAKLAMGIAPFLLKNGTQLDRQYFAAFLARCAESRMGSRVLCQQLLRQISSHGVPLDRDLLDGLLATASASDDLETCISLLQTFDWGHAPLLSTFTNSSELTSRSDLFSFSGGIESSAPTAATYKHLISALTKAEQYESALRCFGAMMTAEHLLDAKLAILLIRTTSRLTDDTAARLLMDTITSGSRSLPKDLVLPLIDTPSGEVFEADVATSRAFCRFRLDHKLREEGLKGATDLMHEWACDGLAIDRELFLVVLQHLDILPGVSQHRIWQTFSDLLGKPNSPDFQQRLRNALSGVLHRHGRKSALGAAGAARVIAQQIEELTGTSLTAIGGSSSNVADTHSVSHLILSLARAHERDRISRRHESAPINTGMLTRLLNEGVISRGATPSPYHLSAIMSYFIALGQPDEAVKVFETATAVRKLDDLKTSLGSPGQILGELLRTYHGVRGIRPNVICYTILIKAYARRSDTTQSYNIFERMVDSGIAPDAIAVLTLAAAWARTGDIARVEALLVPFKDLSETSSRQRYAQPSTQRDVDSDTVATSVRFNALASAGKHLEAQQLLETFLLKHEAQSNEVLFRQFKASDAIALSQWRRSREAAERDWGNVRREQELVYWTQTLDIADQNRIILVQRRKAARRKDADQMRSLESLKKLV